MRHRTRIIAAAAAVAALAGSTAAAVAPATSAAPLTGTQHCSVTKPAATKQVAKQAGSGRALVDESELASRLGVSTARLSQAMRELKMTLAKTGTAPTQQEFDATLAHLLGISQQRVEQVFPDVTATPKSVKVTISTSPSPSASGLKSPGSQSVCGKLPADKVPVPQQSQQLVNAALSAAVAKELNVSAAQVKSALVPLFMAGNADPSSPAFATAAQQLGVSVQQLANALGQAKQSLAPAS